MTCAGKVAFVAGASFGIGATVAAALAATVAVAPGPRSAAGWGARAAPKSTAETLRTAFPSTPQ